MSDEINYDTLMEDALKSVVIAALRIAAEEGLTDKNHFYITFQTTHPMVRMDSNLLNQYPEEMTIVLQHQFANLMLSDDYFEVDLSFQNTPHTLRVPWKAITYFADPYARFALSFSSPIVSPHENEGADKKVSGGTADIVPIEALRKK